MVSGKRDVSGETEAKRLGGKVSYNSVRYIFYVVVKIFNLPVSGPDLQFVGLRGQKFVSGHTKPVTKPVRSHKNVSFYEIFCWGNSFP
jgi:hypothetical protein